MGFEKMPKMGKIAEPLLRKDLRQPIFPRGFPKMPETAYEKGARSP